MRKYLGPLLVVVVVVAILVGVLFWLLSGQTGSGNGTTYTVKMGSISSVVRTTGKVEPERAVELSFKVSDTVKKIYVQPGDFVPAGTLLMELDPTNYQHELDIATAQRDIARFQLSAAGEKAQATATSAISSTQLPVPTVTPAIPVAPSELYAAAKQADIAEEGVKDAQAKLDSTKLYATFDGTVLSINASEGESAGAGQSMIMLADLSKLRVRADVDEIDIANVTSGQKVSFTLDAFPAQSFEGRVGEITPSGIEKQGSTVYQVLVTLNSKPGILVRPGMAANLSITSLAKAGVLTVPSRAIETIGPRKYLTLVNSDNTTTKIEIQTGISNGSDTEILSGIKAGQQIQLPK